LETRIKKNVLFKLIEAIVTIGASLAQLAIISRAYAPSFVGDYQLVLAWLFMVSALSCFGGIMMVSTRDLSKNNDSERRSIFSTAVVLQTVILVPLCISTVYLFYTYMQELALPLAVGTVCLLSALPFKLSEGILMGRDRIGGIVVTSIASHVITTASVAIAAYSGLPLSYLVAAWATYHLLTGVALFLQARACHIFSLRVVRLSLLKSLIREMFPVLVMVLATHLYVRIDVIMLSSFTNKETVAQYSAGYLFLDQLMILSNFMMTAMFPNFARSSQAGGREFHLLYRGIIRVFIRYLFPLATIVAILSLYLLEVTCGPEYSVAWPSLSILMLAAMFAWMNGPSGTIFISLGKQHIYMWATIFSLGVNICGNLVLIPAIGALGAAISTVLTEAAICGFCLYWIYRETAYLPWMQPADPQLTNK